MYQQNALNLLNLYGYNFDLAKFHILYPMIMNDPDKRAQIIDFSKKHPKELASQVANALIDLQGCKQDEIK